MIPSGSSKNILKDNEEKTIEIMINQMLENIQPLLETTKIDLRSLFMGLTKSMNQQDDSLMNVMINFLRAFLIQFKIMNDFTF